MSLKCQQSVNADLNRNFFRCRLNCLVFSVSALFCWPGCVWQTRLWSFRRICLAVLKLNKHSLETAWLAEENRSKRIAIWNKHIAYTTCALLPSIHYCHCAYFVLGLLGLSFTFKVLRTRSSVEMRPTSWNKSLGPISMSPDDQVEAAPPQICSLHTPKNPLLPKIVAGCVPASHEVVVDCCHYDK